jgi:RimJ/RimL family protein N-acetyltransferase
VSEFGVTARPLSFPDEGIPRDGVVYRLPTADDLDALTAAFQDKSLADEANLPQWSRDEVKAAIAYMPEFLESSRILPLVIEDAETGRMLGGAVLHDFNWDLGQIEIGYWLFEHARGRGVATRAARFMAEYGFSLGAERIEARVFVGNTASERVLERAGFTREGVIRSLPRRWGGRSDMTLYSLLPGE